MFELEVGTTALQASELPPDAVAAFGKTRTRIDAFSLTPWEEHCTECAMPACYRTCDLYAPRSDGKCRRFVRGIEMIPFPNHPQGYIAKVAFKRWGQLMAYASTRMLASDDASSIERRVRRAEIFAAAFPGAAIAIADRRGIPSRLTRRWKQRVRDRAGQAIPGAVPDCLLVEVFNPRSAIVRLSVSISSPDRAPYQQLLELEPGFQGVEIPIADISRRVDLSREIHITLNPNILDAREEGLTLYFGLVAFVCLRADPALTRQPAEKPIKVCVWDLDNTLWAGTLIEDGLDGIQLREDAARVVRELDRRGIVNSILSKNDPDDGLAALKHFGLAEYFVFGHIGFEEKGANMKSLIRAFNVDANTFAFIDDQEFERAQVKASNPAVRTYDPANPLALLDRPEFDPPVSSESKSRRAFYRAEEGRVQDQEDWGVEYLAFLRSCAMKVEIGRPDVGSFDRIQELVQRTNQLNYSGTHYSREEIEALLRDPRYDAFTVCCVDRYGEYGTVGFALLDRSDFCLRDAMFSCRIQFKHVEHAVLTFLLHRCKTSGASHFDARFRETKRNGAAAAVFGDIGFAEVFRKDADRLYRFDLSQAIPDERIVETYYEGERWTPSQSSSAG